MATRKTLTLDQRIKKLTEMKERQDKLKAARKAIDDAKANYKKLRG